MRYPFLNVQKSSRQMLDVFKGYNHNLRIGDEEFFDMKNMTSDYYPVLSPRAQRGTYTTPELPLCMIAKDNLCYVDGQYFVMDEYRIDMDLNAEPKQLISMGAYVIILPDKKYINTADISDFGKIEAEVETSSPVSFVMCRVDGSAYNAEFVQDTEPEGPANMTLWIDTSSEPHTLKQWSESSEMWVSIATTYIKIESPGIGLAFEKYDGVQISGLKDKVLHDSNTGEEIEDTSDLAALEGSTIIWDKGDNHIVVVGVMDRVQSISDPITVSRKMPNMDFVVEANNRLWGCRYGTALNGNVVNEIYCSKLGDFKNWNCFMGIATDSWVGSVGTDGQFTGAITYLGFPLFFKENVLHKVYISEIGAHGIQDTACRGVQRGCSKSLAIVNETLLYKARSGVMSYDGSLPVEASYELGEVRYGNAVAGAHRNKYYISMENTETKENELLVYDVSKRLWHKEDNLKADSFCTCREELYAISGGKIITMLGSGDRNTDSVEWMLQTGEIGISSPDMKYISRLTIRLSMDIGAELTIRAQYDLSDKWEDVCTIRSTSLRSFSIPIRPKRCDHMKIRLDGIGNAKIYSVTKTIELGSELS